MVGHGQGTVMVRVIASRAVILTLFHWRAFLGVPKQPRA